MDSLTDYTPSSETIYDKATATQFVVKPLTIEGGVLTLKESLAKLRFHCNEETPDIDAAARRYREVKHRSIDPWYPVVVFHVHRDTQETIESKNFPRPSIDDALASIRSVQASSATKLSMVAKSAPAKHWFHGVIGLILDRFDCSLSQVMGKPPKFEGNNLGLVLFEVCKAAEVEQVMAEAEIQPDHFVRMLMAAAESKTSIADVALARYATLFSEAEPTDEPSEHSDEPDDDPSEE